MLSKQTPRLLDMHGLTCSCPLELGLSASHLARLARNAESKTHPSLESEPTASNRLSGDL